MDIKDLTYGFKGGDDLASVVDVDFGGGYEWDEFHAWYSPSQRRYFWASGSGCSCNSWGDDIYKLDDMESGSKADLERSLRSYLDGVYEARPSDVLDTMAEVKRFRP